MCKSKAEGGRRCASHTRADLRKAYKVFQENPSEETFQVLSEKLSDYNTTKTGFSELKTGHQWVLAEDPLPFDEHVPVIVDGVLTDEAPEGWAGRKLYEDQEAEVERLADERLALYQREQDIKQERKEVERSRIAEEQWEAMYGVYEDPSQLDYRHEHGLDDDAEARDYFDPASGQSVPLYDEYGYNKLTGADVHGFDRLGIFVGTGSTRDPQGLDKDGYSQDGYDAFGLDRHGFTRIGWNPVTESFRDRYGYDRRGFDKDGIHRDTGTRYSPPPNERDRNGIDREGYDRRGWNKEGIHKVTKTYYNPDGYDEKGVDALGLERPDERTGFIRNTLTGDVTHRDTGEAWDPAGFDPGGVHKTTKTAFDENGYDRWGYNKKGFDRNSLLNPDKVLRAGGTPLKLINGDNQFLSRFRITEAEGWKASGIRNDARLRVTANKVWHYRRNPRELFLTLSAFVLENTGRKEKKTIYSVGVEGSDRFHCFDSLDDVKKHIHQEIGQILSQQRVENGKLDPLYKEIFAAKNAR